jgi:hypothetical protein
MNASAKPCHVEQTCVSLRRQITIFRKLSPAVSFAKISFIAECDRYYSAAFARSSD